MTHNLGCVIAVSQVISDSDPFQLVLSPSPIGSPRFALLRFINVSLSASARLEVDLGYATDTFTSGGGDTFYTRAADAATAPTDVRIVGGTGSALLLEYGSGEPTETANTPGTSTGSQSNPDPFLHTDPMMNQSMKRGLNAHPTLRGEMPRGRYFNRSQESHQSRTRHYLHHT